MKLPSEKLAAEKEHWRRRSYCVEWGEEETDHSAGVKMNA